MTLQTVLIQEFPPSAVDPEQNGNLRDRRAGSIGLSTAFILAQSFFNASVKARIIVIDIFDKPFAAASSQCTGCFHYAFPEKESQPLVPLGKYSFDLWAAQAESEDFKKRTGFRAHSCFGVNPGIGKGIEALPDWIQSKSTWDIDQDVLGPRNATVYVLPRSHRILRSHLDHPTAIQQVLASGSQLSASSWE